MGGRGAGVSTKDGETQGQEVGSKPRPGLWGVGGICVTSGSIHTGLVQGAFIDPLTEIVGVDSGAWGLSLGICISLHLSSAFGPC